MTHQVGAATPRRNDQAEAVSDGDEAGGLLGRARALIGRPAGTPNVAGEPVNRPMIRHWCDAVGDRNPIYLDEDEAAASTHGGLVAPPAMLQVWTMRGLSPEDRKDDALGQVVALLAAAGFGSVVATNCEQEYRRALRPGDILSETVALESVSDEKRTGLGTGHFVTSLSTYEDQDGEVVGTMRFRVLAYRPAARPEAAAEVETRPWPRPQRSLDTAFFWEGIEAGELRIQRCSSCQTLRHPARPMCAECQSLEWDWVVASGRGTIYSFVVMHHPPIPPFSYPNVVVLVELEEGTRLVSRLVDADQAAVKIGMPVCLAITAPEPGLELPFFRLDTETSGGQ